MVISSYFDKWIGGEKSCCTYSRCTWWSLNKRGHYVTTIICSKKLSPFNPFKLMSGFCQKNPWAWSTNQVTIVYKPHHWRGTKTISGRIRRRKIPKISFSRFFFVSIKKVRCCTETFSRKFVSRKKNRSSSLSRRFFRFRERAMPASAAAEFFVVGCNYRKKLNDVTLFSLKGEKPPTRKLENIGVATLARTATDLARFFKRSLPNCAY